MTSRIDPVVQSATAMALDTQPAGSWKLRAGRAIPLRCNEASVLRIARGRVWVTTDAVHVGPPNDLGDFFLHAGEQMTLPANRRVVIEPWNPQAKEPAYFSWDPQPCMQQGAAMTTTRWQGSVVSPMRDLGHALGMALQALGRLAWGIGSYGEYLVAGRGRVMPSLESNAP